MAQFDRQTWEGIYWYFSSKRWGRDWKAGLRGEGEREFFLFVERNADVVQW